MCSGVILDSINLQNVKLEKLYDMLILKRYAALFIELLRTWGKECSRFEILKSFSKLALIRMAKVDFLSEAWG